MCRIKLFLIKIGKPEYVKIEHNEALKGIQNKYKNIPTWSEN